MGDSNLLAKEAHLTKILNIDIALILAPMAGSATTPELTAAVSNAGGLGSIGAGYMTGVELAKEIQKTRALTSKAFAVNLFIPSESMATEKQLAFARDCVEQACRPLNLAVPSVKPPFVPSFDEQIKVVLDENIPVFSFAFGVLEKRWIAECKARGIVLIGTATNLLEAELLAREGADIIVAQGSEAGGHRGTFLTPVKEGLIKLEELLTQLIAHVKTPIVAAGGLMSAEAIQTVLAQGAAGVQLGTAFLTSPECGIHAKYKAALLNLKKDETTLTRAFSGKFARGLNNDFIRHMQEYENSILAYPIQHALTKPMRKEAERQGNIEYMSLWAGQNAFQSKGLSVLELIKKFQLK